MKSEKTDEIPFAQEVVFDNEKWSKITFQTLFNKLPMRYKSNDSFEFLKFYNRIDKKVIENLKKALFQKSISNDSVKLEQKLQQNILKMKKEIGLIPNKKKKGQLEKTTVEYDQIKKYNQNINFDSNINHQSSRLINQFTKYMNGTYPKIDFKNNLNYKKMTKAKKMTPNSNLLVKLLFLDDFNCLEMSSNFIYTPTTVLKSDLLQFITTHIYYCKIYKFSFHKFHDNGKYIILPSNIRGSLKDGIEIKISCQRKLYKDICAGSRDVMKLKNEMEQKYDDKIKQLEQKYDNKINELMNKLSCLKYSWLGLKN